MAVPRQVAPRRVAQLQARYLQRMGATPQEIRRWRPILTAQIGAESDFTQGVGSSAGAQDIAQFMPGTAPGYGVRLGDNRIKDDIRGQVRYMLPLLRKYGVEGALRGYNAGVGAIERSKGFSETNNYVQRVRSTADQYRHLAGVGGGGGGGGNLAAQLQALSGPSGGSSLPEGGGSTLALLQALQAGQGASQPASGGLAAPAHSAAPVLPQGAQAALSGGGPAAKPDVAALMAAIRTVGGGMPGVPSAGGGMSGGGGGGAPGAGGGGNPKVKGPLLELFYNGPGGVNVDEGKIVGKGFVSGHTGHVHVAAANSKTAIRLGKLAQRMGLTVREHPHFDPVDPVHTEGSFHYRKQAIDVSGDPRKMAAFSRRVARLYGLR